MSTTTTNKSITAQLNDITTIADWFEYGRAVDLLNEAWREVALLGEDARQATLLQSVASGSAVTDTLMSLLKGIQALEAVLLECEEPLIQEG